MIVFFYNPEQARTGISGDALMIPQFGENSQSEYLTTDDFKVF